MADKISGYLEVGINDQGEVIVVHRDIVLDQHGTGYIAFSPNQAIALAKLLIAKAKEAEES